MEPKHMAVDKLNIHSHKYGSVREVITKSSFRIKDLFIKFKNILIYFGFMRILIFNFEIILINI